MLKTTVVIPVYNGARFLPACLEALRLQQGAGCEVIAVDNASSDGSRELIAASFPEVTLIRNARNEGFSRGVNAGIRYAQAQADPAEIVILLNQDTIVAPNWLHQILLPFSDQTIGAVGCKIYDHDGETLQHAGGLIDYPRATTHHIGLDERDEGQYEQAGDLPYLTGAALALRTRALDQIGLLDERFSPAYMEEVDLCWRLHAASWQVWYNPAAQVRHFEHGSPLNIIPRLTLLHRNRLRFVFKHYRAEQLLDDFWPAERRALWQAINTFDQAALQRAYLDVLTQFDDFCAARADMKLPAFSSGERQALQKMVRELRSDLIQLRRLQEVTRLEEKVQAL